MTDIISSINDHDALRKTAEALLKLMGFANILVTLKKGSENDPLVVAVSMDDAGILIGEHGANLRALEYVIKLVARKVLADMPHFIVDVNNYREEKISELREYARGIAGRVVREKREIEMDPMSSFERRIIHNELTSHPGVITESTGEGIDRRIVVRLL
jgi:spoIIIJ-associated protein